MWMTAKIETTDIVAKTVVIRTKRNAARPSISQKTSGRTGTARFTLSLTNYNRDDEAIIFYLDTKRPKIRLGKRLFKYSLTLHNKSKNHSVNVEVTHW